MKAVITGANRGIGLALCAQLVKKGYEVFALCRKKSKELEKLSAKVIEKVDVTDIASLEKAKIQINTPLDLIVNNAGIYHRDTFEDIDFNEITLHFEVNSIAPLKVVKTFLPLLKSGSKVIMISSTSGSITNADSGKSFSYKASKAALNMLSKNLAIFLKEKKISVGIFHPGYVKTDMTSDEATLEPKESAQGLAKLIEELSLENSGEFRHVEGHTIPW
ncbi:MAG: short-chain dehydrogenase [Chlamydiae bacterium CG10_big_fil_rev_8_21_14_0_10_35_9]|nr:MAG: short-chain dehydrogenase [Chlamydiae bacterium CG10_big_fil_rev_8_21_14_0_10_35_9]